MSSSRWRGMRILKGHLVSNRTVALVNAVDATMVYSVQQWAKRLFLSHRYVHIVTYGSLSCIYFELTILADAHNCTATWGSFHRLSRFLASLPYNHLRYISYYLLHVCSTTSKEILSLIFLHMNEVDSSINCLQYSIAKLRAKLLGTVVSFTCSANIIRIPIPQAPWSP